MKYKIESRTEETEQTTRLVKSSEVETTRKKQKTTFPPPSLRVILYFENANFKNVKLYREL